MKNLKFSLLATLLITTIALFLVSCEQTVIENQIEETVNLSESTLVDALTADQTFVDVVLYTLSEENSSTFVTYLETTLIEDYPQFAEMDEETFMSIIGQAANQIMQMDTIDERDGDCPLASIERRCWDICQYFVGCTCFYFFPECERE